MNNTRPCKCGCGAPVVIPGRMLAACRKRLKREWAKGHRSLSRRPIVMGTRTEPMKPKRRVCTVCFDLSERRESICPGCGLPWAAERRSA